LLLGGFKDFFCLPGLLEKEKITLLNSIPLLSKIALFRLIGKIEMV
jgi:hypothetical protein